MAQIGLRVVCSVREGQTQAADPQGRADAVRPLRAEDRGCTEGGRGCAGGGRKGEAHLVTGERPSGRVPCVVRDIPERRSVTARRGPLPPFVKGAKLKRTLRCTSRRVAQGFQLTFFSNPLVVRLHRIGKAVWAGKSKTRKSPPKIKGRFCLPTHFDPAGGCQRARLAQRWRGPGVANS
jgi:hypothetical protein